MIGQGHQAASWAGPFCAAGRAARQPDPPRGRSGEEAGTAPTTLRLFRATWRRMEENNMTNDPQEQAKAENEARKARNPMLNQTAQTGNPLSNQTSRPGNQADYEPGQLVEESNKAEGHTGNKGAY
jgi:hypothetical protein